MDNYKKQLVEQLAYKLGVKPSTVDDLIWAESGYDPRAKNPKSSARGLMQWIDQRAKDLKYNSSLELIQNNPSFEDQINLMYIDLKRFMPFANEHEFFMSIFRPADRKKNPYTHKFPQRVIDVNHGISTPAEYTAFVKSQALKKKRVSGVVKTSPFLILGAVAAVWWISKQK